ncbi:MAG: hypothetical protein FJ264_15615 [Planctomycetes bacterium]|nr:hypothetical protein [Planctomycetota bacterium]
MEFKKTYRFVLYVDKIWKNTQKHYIAQNGKLVGCESCDMSKDLVIFDTYEKAQIEARRRMSLLGNFADTTQCFVVIEEVDSNEIPAKILKQLTRKIIPKPLIIS